jgi:hypothetical protein
MFLTLSLLLVLVWGIFVPAYAETVTISTDYGPLVGTLEQSACKKSIATILIISGSGPTDRDGNSAILPGKNNSLRYLAESLSANCISSLRYDKRLIGESKSTKIKESDIRFDTYVTDVNIMMNYIEKESEEPLYLLGHSEGALIAILAAKQRKINGIISVAGQSKKASDIILEQAQINFPKELQNETVRIIDSFLLGKIVDNVSQELAPIFRESVQPYMISWMKYDPIIELDKLDVPLLVVNGTSDIQVPVSHGKNMANSYNRSKFVQIEGMNHVLKLASGEAQAASYVDPSLPISDKLVSTIVEFIKSAN